MRRNVASAVAGALLAAVLMSGFQAAAAAPYVYGCTPADYPLGYASGTGRVKIYNGSGAAANITMKFLAFDGTNLNVPMGITTNFTVGATTTKYMDYTTPAGAPETGNTAPSTVRIVSDQSIEASADVPYSPANIVVQCAYLHP
jgi:hypothetical protein